MMDNKTIGKPFLPGKSGNPLGRPPMASALKDRLRTLTPAAIETVRGIMNNARSKPETRLQAAQMILAYSLGKPKNSTPIDDTDDDGKTIIVFNVRRPDRENGGQTIDITPPGNEQKLEEGAPL